MIQLAIAAFAMGVLGSFHCVGMCGPIALSLPISNTTFWAKFSGAFIYNVGRVVTYAILGLVLGVLGKSIALLGFQQGLSIFLGVLIIIILGLPKKYPLVPTNNFVAKFFAKIRRGIAQLFFKKNKTSLFAIGLLNGLLPCGLVYMAAAGAIATTHILHSIFFMIFFGMGTLPLMWSMAFLGNYITLGIRQKIKQLYPYTMMLMACLLILRGMGLGIPYISPKADVEKKVTQNCCAKPDKIH